MPGPILLFPSRNENALLEAIKRANTENRLLSLEPGTHLTNRGYGRDHKIEIGAYGLTMRGMTGINTAATIKRTDLSINAAFPDDNFGLFFIPAHASTADFENVTTWKSYTKTTDAGDTITFQYAVIIRGFIDISDLTIDCNMDKQNLQTIYDNSVPGKESPAEHSCMLGFSGIRTEGKGIYAGKNIYIAFSSVILNNILTKNGGYADDIWIGRGYFNPNIEKVKISNIKSENRVDPHRATISFSGLAQIVDINNADIYKLECEETSTGFGQWGNLPRKDTVYQPSQWKIRKVNADIIDIAVKGKAIMMDGRNLYTKTSFGVYQVGGQISNSTFHKGEEPRLIRLNDMTFRDVKWILSANKCTKRMLGIRPVSQDNDECIIHFINNEFKVRGEFVGGSLITSEYSTNPVDGNPDNDITNNVTVSLVDCKYDSRFGDTSNPDPTKQTHIIEAKERGTWTIKEADYSPIPRAIAVIKGSHADISVIYI